MITVIVEFIYLYTAVNNKQVRQLLYDCMVHIDLDNVDVVHTWRGNLIYRNIPTFAVLRLFQDVIIVVFYCVRNCDTTDRIPSNTFRRGKHHARARQTRA